VTQIYRWPEKFLDFIQPEYLINKENKAKQNKTKGKISRATVEGSQSNLRCWKRESFEPIILSSRRE
jgi:ferredoxin-fold anticodon binding domain-containing protein